MLRKLLKVLAALFVLSALAAGLLVWNINPVLESLKPRLQAVLSDKLQKQVSFEKLSFRFLPSLALELNNLQLTDGTKDGTKLERLVLQTKLFPLFVGEFLIEELEVDGLELRITKQENGALEVGGSPLGAKASSGKESADKGDAPEEEKKKSKLAFNVTRAQLTRGRVTFSDRSVSPPQEISVSDIAAEAKGITADGIQRFAASARVLGDKPDITLEGSGTKAGGSGTLTLDRLDLTKLSTLLKAYDKLPPDLAIGKSLSAKLEAKLASGQVELQARVDATDADVLYKDLFEKPASTRALVSAKGTVALLGAAHLESLSWQLGKLELDTPVTKEGEQTSVAVRTKGFSLAELATFVPPLRAFEPRGEIDADVKTSFGGSGASKLVGGADLRGLGLRLARDEAQPLEISDATGHADLTEEAVSVKPLTLSVNGQKLDVGARYAPPGPTGKLQVAAKAEELRLAPILASFSKTVDPALASSLLKQLQLSATYSGAQRTGGATIGLESGTLSELPIGPTKLSLDVALDEQNKPRTATLQPSTLQLFGGSISVQGALQNGNAVTAQVKASGLDIAKVVAFASPDAKVKATGTLSSFSLQLAGPLEGFGAHARGPLALEATKGTIEGFNLLAQTLGKIDQIPGLGQALLAFVPEKHRPLLQVNSTPFDRLSVSSQLAGRDVSLQSVQLVHSLYSVNGNGKIEASGDLDISAQLALSEQLTGGMVEKEQKLRLLLDSSRSMVIPVVIKRSGGLFVVLPDVTNLGKRALGNTAKDAASKALDKVAPGLGGALDSLFK